MQQLIFQKHQNRMSIIIGALFWNILGLVTAFLAVFYAYAKWCYQYWERRNIPYLPPTFPFGNTENLFNRKKSISAILRERYDEISKKNLRYGGMYLVTNPILIITDLDLIKSILIKDFDHFTHRGAFHNEKGDPLSAHLFNIDGPKWRHLRTKLSPTFTSGKMKLMFETMAICAPNMSEFIGQHLNEPIKIKDVTGRFTIDIIGSCAFGLECNSFKDPSSPFRTYGAKVFHRTPARALKQTFVTAFPKIALALNARLFPKDAEEFFMGILRDTIKYREQNQVKRNDFLQLLIEMQNELTFNEIAAECVLFFVAGFDTTATTMTFALYNLARNEEVQEKLRLEVKKILKKYEYKLSYDAVSEMQYMRQVVDETLRLYPPFGALFRECVKDFDLGDGNILKKGESVRISTLGIHMDEKYYPNAEVFDPERFSEENRQSINPFTYLPFGNGPRNCIGLRFGLLQAKVGLATLLSKYEFTVNSLTKEPLEMEPKSVVMTAKGDIWLNVTKIEE